MSDIKVEVANVTKIFGKKPRGRAAAMLAEGASKDAILEETGHVVGLHDVTFDVAQGEVFVVMGLSGSGKSTLIRTLNRLVEPTSGSIKIDGQEITDLTPTRLQELRRTKISMVFQHFGLLPHKNIIENVAYGLKVQGLAERDRLEKAAEALDLVGLGAWGQSRPDELSGGMQQRVGLARALATDPDILLMDEAFSALDPLIRRQMQDEMLELQERVHKTIVFITHDLNEALRVGTRVAIMQDGAVVQIGEPDRIITEPETKYVADFIQDVDQGRVLAVSSVQTDEPVAVAGRATVSEARDLLRSTPSRGLYVVDGTRRVIGLLTEDELQSSADDGDLASIARQDYPATTGDATIAETYALCASGLPVVVQSKTGRYEGTVEPLAVLDKLGVVEQIAERTDFPEPGPQDAPATEVI